ncbi:LysR family transcriptional regulator [Chelonobacter oris]|uniref:LysR family transcriptional regulator n=1 Tax=Chelonobacter oris TaxID=505317 RepID=A0A0A3AKZ8_9PAST|nr:LysR family transcriptional regulator [Chelonobacter oris]KGQ70016.1 LysR family transcriptional regulator [Chelonobacter oris]
MKLDLDALNIFVQIVDSGSLSGAAARLDLPVSAVSRQLARLEGNLQLTLLQRSTRRMQLSDEGRLLLAQARRILDEVHLTEERLAMRRAEAGGLLRVNTSVPVMLHVLAPLLHEFRRQYPQIDIELDSNDNLIDLIEARTDVALRIGRLQDSAMHARLLGHTAVCVLAAPAYLAQHGTPQTSADLARHALLGFRSPASLNQWPLLDHNGRLLEIEPAIRASGGETLRHLALAGNGIVCLSELMTWQDRQNGTLVPVLPAQQQTVTQPLYAVYYRHRTLSARTAVWIDFLAQQIPQMPWYRAQAAQPSAG